MCVRYLNIFVCVCISKGSIIIICSFETQSSYTQLLLLLYWTSTAAAAAAVALLLMDKNRKNNIKNDKMIWKYRSKFILIDIIVIIVICFRVSASLSGVSVPVCMSALVSSIYIYKYAAALNDNEYVYFCNVQMNIYTHLFVIIQANR